MIFKIRERFGEFFTPKSPSCKPLNPTGQDWPLQGKQKHFRFAFSLVHGNKNFKEVVEDLHSNEFLVDWYDRVKYDLLRDFCTYFGVVQGQNTYYDQDRYRHTV